jgi:excisionase family DNA binding protein
MHLSPNRPEPLAYTIADAMHVARLGRTKLYELIQDGKLATVTVGRRRLISAASLAALLTPKAA